MISLIHGCDEGVSVIYIHPDASSSMPYTCGDMERYWSYDSEQSTMNTYRLPPSKVRILEAELDRIVFSDIDGGYYPRYKFIHGGDTICVTAGSVVIRNDRRIAVSRPLYLLLEEGMRSGGQIR